MFIFNKVHPASGIWDITSKVMKLYTHFTHPPPTSTPRILQQPRPQPTTQIPYETAAPTFIELVDIIRKSKNGK